MNLYSLLRHATYVSVILLSFFCKLQSIFIPFASCEKDSLGPCKNHPSLPGSIICENIQDIQTFVKVLRCNRNKNIQEVFLVESTIDYMPLYIMDFCGFSFLNLKSVSMKKLIDGNDMIRLQQLHLDNVSISRPWNWEPLVVLKRLQRFAVSNMEVKTLDESLLDHLNENLQSFILTSTNTASIGDFAFQKFDNIVYLSIQDNNIQHLKRSMFPTPSKIKYFYFGKNKITSLPRDIFQNMPDLQAVALQDNLISELHELAFRRIWKQLSYVLLEGNPLKCNCKMLWLSKRITPSVFQGKCYSPKKYFGKELKDLKLTDFHCF